MDLLVSTDWLADELGAADLVVLDASAHLPTANRDPAADFAEAHVPGARFLDLPSLKDPQSPVPNAIPTRDQLEKRLRDLGVNAGDRIVLYDDSMVKTSARAWFMLRHYDYPHVTILDGGLGKWKAEGRPLESGSAACEKGDIKLKTARDDVRSKADMLANIGSGQEQVIDARDAGRFTGETVDAVHDLPGGHIPGARNLFFGDLFAADGTFLSRDELAARFEAAGVDTGRPIAASCGSGVTASVVLFALQMLGEDGALYDGSWSEWGADPATPKATGPAA